MATINGGKGRFKSPTLCDGLIERGMGQGLAEPPPPSAPGPCIGGNGIGGTIGTLRNGTNIPCTSGARRRGREASTGRDVAAA